MTAPVRSADVRSRPGGAVVQVHTEDLGGSPLSRAIQARTVPAAWFRAAPATPGAWVAQIREVQGDFANAEWFDAIKGALSPDGPGRERLERAARGNGVVVTTGQQPGLFGGPVYTWSKALSALALADAIEREAGIPAAPLFWAATDDADLAEAQSAWLATEGGATELRGPAVAAPGTPAAATPQGDLRRELAALRDAAGSAAGSPVLALVEAAYGDPSRTIGDAYVALLRGVLGPLGICVLDAADAHVTRAGNGILRAALERSAPVAAALAARASDIRAHGFQPQVDDMPGLTPVFVRERGVKRRVRVDEAASVLADGTRAALSPNVLLRPVMERAIVPTVAYVAGPGELAYFAQVTALAASLGVRVPVAVPRWSGTIVEPHVQRVLDRLGITRDAVAEPHAVEGALARAALPGDVRDALAALRASVAAGIDAVAHSATDDLLPAPVIEGLRRRLSHQLDRFERRALAGIKRREAASMRDVGTVRGYFFPGGARQERAMSLVPALARQGSALVDAMLQQARLHAARIVGSE